MHKTVNSRSIDLACRTDAGCLRGNPFVESHLEIVGAENAILVDADGAVIGTLGWDAPCDLRLVEAAA
jgi:hypothetical protein